MAARQALQPGWPVEVAPLGAQYLDGFFLGAVGLMSSPLWRDVPPAPATVPVPVPGAPEFAARDLPLSDPQFKELLQILNLRARGAEESPVEEALALIGREDPDWIDRFIERDDVRAHIALLGLPDGHHPGPRHAGLLLAVLREQYYPPRKRFRAIAHLRRTFNDRSVALVLRIALDAKDEPIFKAAVQTIARFSKEKVPSTVPDTLATLAMARNFKAAVPDALDLLARTETQSLQTWAHDILDGKHDTQVPDGYYTAARYIGSLEASLFPVLERLAKDGGDEKGRAYALERLAVVQPTSAWPAELRKLASAEKDWKRILLAAHLQQHATSDDLPLLRSLAIDDHPKVQFLARSTLQRLKTSPDGDDEDQTRPDNRLPGHH